MFGRDHRRPTPVRAWEGIAAALRKSDFFLCNLETTIGTGGVPRDKQFVFRSPPAVLDRLGAFPRAVAGLANNHMMDFGVEGLAGTLAVLDAGSIAHAGAGMNATGADAPAVLSSGGLTIQVFSAGMDNDPRSFAGDALPGIAPISLRVLRQQIA